MAKNKSYYVSSVSLVKPEIKVKLGKKTLHPAESTITYSAINDNLDGYTEVTVSKIPEEYIIPSGTFDIKNTALIDISEYKYARVLDSNLIPNNIVKGVSILGIIGNYKPDLPNIYTTSEIEKILKKHYTNTLNTTDNEEYLIEGTVKEIVNHPSAKVFVIGDDTSNAVIYFRYNSESGETWEEFVDKLRKILVDDYIVVKSKLRYYENGYHNGEYGTSTLSTGSSSEFEGKIYYPEVLLHKKEVRPISMEVVPSTNTTIVSENKFTVTIEGDTDLIPENILKDIDIFGVTGTLEPYTEPEIKSAIAIPKEIDQVFSENNYTVTVKGDSNLTPDKILQGVSIFGVSGNVRPYEEPDIYTQYVIPGTNEQIYSKNNYTVTIAGDTDLIPENIRQGKEIFGVIGTLKSDITGNNLLPALCNGSIETLTKDELEGARRIMSYMFYDSILQTIELPDSVEEIGSYAFYNNSNLKSVSTSSNLTTIKNSAFYRCTNLPSIVIPQSVTSIGSSAFYRCDNLTIYCELPSQPSTWDANWNSSNCPVVWGYLSYPITLNDIVYNLSTISHTAIATDTTENLKSLYEVEIAKEIEKDGAVYPVNMVPFGLLSSNTVLTKLTIPFVGNLINGTNNTHLGFLFGADEKEDNKKYVPSTLTHVVVTGNTLPAYSFYDCEYLTTIEIPDELTQIEPYVFYGCNSLNDITLPDSLISIGDYAFVDCTSLTSITIPEGVTSIEEYAFAGCSRVTNITIPDSVTKIWNYAFSNWDGLTSITIPNSVTSIGWGIFYNASNLRSVTLPNNITEIPAYIFSGCTSLTTVSIPNSVTKIGFWAFEYCESLTSITIPNSVTSIGEYAFNACTSLKRITIPNSVTSIGEYLFNNCFDLENITFLGTIAQWNAIEKGSYWNDDISATYVQCTDGQVNL